MMMQIAVVYFTNTDITGQLVRAMLGHLSTKADVTLFEHRIVGKEIIEGRFKNRDLFQQLLVSDALIFASPTYMGGVAAQFKAFADASSDYWSEQEWRGKLAAGITCGSAPNGDQSSTLQYMATLASQHGMIWVGLDSAYGYRDQGINRLGCQLGVTAQATEETAHATDLQSAIYLGERVYTFARRLQQEPS